jgi:CheY-like chemotaxis protein
MTIIKIIILVDYKKSSGIIDFYFTFFELIMNQENENKYKIIFADPSDSVLTVFKIFENELNELEDGRFDCFFTSSGTEVLSELEKADYALAVIDNNLPGLDGLKILEKLALSDIKTPVIFQTARGSEQIAVKAFRLGIKDYFVKSQMSFEELYSSMMNAINHQDGAIHALTPIPDVPALNFLTHHLESVLKGYMQEISEEDLIPGQEYIFAFLSTKVIHDPRLEKILGYDELKSLHRNIKSYISNTAKEFRGMKWIDKEDFSMHTFVGKNLVSNCFMCAMNIICGLVTYNLAQKGIPYNFLTRITLNYGEAKYEPNKEVVISSALNYNVHSVHSADDPGLYVSEFFYANMEDKLKKLFAMDFELEGIQNFKFNFE